MVSISWNVSGILFEIVKWSDFLIRITKSYICSNRLPLIDALTKHASNAYSWWPKICHSTQTIRTKGVFSIALWSWLYDSLCFQVAYNQKFLGTFSLFLIVFLGRLILFRISVFKYAISYLTKCYSFDRDFFINACHIHG